MKKREREKGEKKKDTSYFIPVIPHIPVGEPLTLA